MPYFFILFGALLRVIPHPANFAPIAAIALFGGTYLNKRLAIALPLVAMVLSDFLIGFDSLESRLVVYGCFAVSGLIGMFIRKHKNFGTIVGGSLFSSVIFYLATNFVYFHGTEMYPHTFAGMIQAYVNAIPFFRNTLLGDLSYVAILFGGYEAILAYKNSKAQIQTAKLETV
jgi:hypothetical protein